MQRKRTGCLWWLQLLALAGVLLTFAGGCISIPPGLQPVRGFQAERYMGKWYEIARLDHSFERNLTRVTADYTLREDGRVGVVNLGFDARRGRWREIEGTARFAGDRTEGRLKVTFFWPFWGAYNIIALDQKDYRYAVVAGPSRSYLWILCRDPKMDEDLLADLVRKAKQWGFDVDRLIYLEPNKRPVPQTSLAEAIAHVLKVAAAPMRLTAVAKAVKATGYKSKAKRFDKMVHKALNGLAAAQRVGRRRYVYEA